MAGTPTTRAKVLARSDRRAPIRRATELGWFRSTGRCSQDKGHRTSLAASIPSCASWSSTAWTRPTAPMSRSTRTPQSSCTTVHSSRLTTTKRGRTRSERPRERALDRGVNLVFFGAAALVRHARLQPSPLGPDRELVDYRDSSEDPLDTSGGANTVTGNTFATPPTSDPVTSLVGSEYSGYVLPAVASLPFVVYAVTSWIFKGTGLKAGASVPGVIRSDINHVNPTAAPSDLEVLGHSPIPLADAYSNQGQWNGDTYSDMTYYTRPTGGGGVFDSGTVNWLYALNPCASTGGSCTGLAVGLITANLLRAVGGGPAGKSHPSVPNAKTVVPPGS